MVSFSKRPLRQKLMLVMLSTSLVSILLLGTGLFVYEYYTVRERMVADHVNKAEILAANCNAALAFDNSPDASHVLSSLMSQPNILAAAVYTDKGRLFASYLRSGLSLNLPAHPAADGYHFGNGKLDLFHPVTVNNARIGTLFLSSDLEGLNDHFISFGQIALLVLAGALTAGYFAASALQARISGPIMELVGATKRISEQQDYSVRARKMSEDELGSLVDTFNAMLSRIQQRDSDLRNSESRYRSTLDHMMEGCQIIGFDYRYLYVNDAAVSQSRYTRQELLGRTMMDIYPGIDEAGFFGHLRECMEKRMPHKMVNEFKYPDGSSGWFNLSMEPVPEGTFILSEDITRTREQEGELKKHREHLEELVVERTSQLEAANKELEAFSYSVSHDLRAPLRHIDGFSDLLTTHSRAVLDNKGLHYLSTISNAAKRMGMLIDDLLVFSRMGRTEMRNSIVDTAQMLQEVIREVSEEGRTLDWRVEPLPHVQADPPMLRVVLVNLLSNAVKYTRPRPVAIIEIGCAVHDHEVVFHVRDNGVGFDMAYIRKLFGVFQRLHSSDQFEGTGIGLANVHRIIHRHGGRTWAESELNKGATFYFSLPLSPAVAAHSHTNHQPETGDTQ